MKVVVTGNVGTSVLERLSADPSIGEIVGIARRAPIQTYPRTRFVTADVAESDLDPIFHGARCVIHLAWRLQPSHHPESLHHTNVEGSRRVFEAAARSGAESLLYASSIGAYGDGPKDRLVDETFPTTGIETSVYSIQKSLVERVLDLTERNYRRMRVVRFRPALIFKREAASDIRRLFLGPLLPRFVFSAPALSAVPDHPRLRFQCVHASDVGRAFHIALHRPVRGPFNLAAEPIIDSQRLAARLNAKRLRMSRSLLRSMTGLAWHARLLPAGPGWIDLAFDTPLIASDRARTILGWAPAWAADDALLELLDGLREGAGIDTPPLAPRRGLDLFRAADPAP